MDKFVAKQDDSSRKLAEETIGLVKLDEFQKIVKETTGSADHGAPSGRGPSPEEVEKQRKKLKQRAAKLSFDLEEPEEGADASLENIKGTKIGPNPSALIQGQLEAKNFAEAQRIREEEELAKIKAEEEFVKSRANASLLDTLKTSLCRAAYKAEL